VDIEREERMIPSAARATLSPEEAAAAVKVAAATAESKSGTRPLEGNLNEKRSTRIDTKKAGAPLLVIRRLEA
jgi:hypothetical protein